MNSENAVIVIDSDDEVEPSSSIAAESRKRLREDHDASKDFVTQMQ
jgi:hypothetical protein